MTSEADDRATGYPGFDVQSVPPLRPTPATLKRIALAKLSSVQFFSASLSGESHVFSPWLTARIDFGTVMRFLGVYRTDPELDDDGNTVGSSPEWLCVRRSEWIREIDIAQAGETDDLGDYLARGPQLTDRFCFGTSQTHASTLEATTATLRHLASGFTIAATPPRQTTWQDITIEIADDYFTPTFNYSPLLAQCTVVETHLPAWLDTVERAAQQQGVAPDGDIALEIQRSVPELVNADFRPSRRTQ